MSSETRLALGIVVVAGLIAGVVSFFPALTSGGSSRGASIPDEELQQIVSVEEDHCQDHLDGVDCVCFGGVSGLIQADTTSRVPTAYYADKQDLARWQAEDKC